MAKYKNGINGPFSGKIGPVTGSSWLGVPYIKSNNSIGSGKAPSIKQLNQRRVFGMVSSWLKPMKHWIEIGYGNVEGRTPMNAAISFVMKHAIRDAEPSLAECYSADAAIDYPKMVWSRGELLVSVVTKLEWSGNLLRLEWLDGLPSFYSRADDKAVFILYNEDKNQFAVFSNAAVRSDGAAELELPQAFAADRLHSWMFYHRVSGQLSTSVYCGQIIS